MRFGLSEWRRRLRAVEPGAFLLPGHAMRRLLRRLRGYSGFIVPLPRRKVLIVDGELLAKLLSPAELGLKTKERLPKVCFALRLRDSSRSLREPMAETLRAISRELFHARVLVTLQNRRLTQAEVRERIALIGQTAFDEVRGILGAEGWLLPVEKDRTVYATFVAVFLELQHFAPHELERYFPAREHHAAWSELFAREVDAKTLLERSWIEGAAREEPVRVAKVRSEALPQAADSRPPAEVRGEVDRLLQRAEEAGRLGNSVRAALLRMRAGELAEPGAAAQLHSDARQSLRELATRLREALGAPADDEGIIRAIASLLPRAMRPFWTPEARFLYDLQKVCLRVERGVRGTSLLGWLRSFGRAPLQREQPLLAEAMICRSLRTAKERLPRLSLTETDWRLLDQWLSEEVTRLEDRLRLRLRPILAEECRRAGFVWSNAPERVGVERLVDELLDKLVHEGHLGMSQVRDVIARNDVKLPRCDGPKAFWADRLIRLDRGLKARLDGIYRPGEFYLRWLHRASALLFGTHVGRWMSLYLLLPFGGAWVVMVGLLRTVTPHGPDKAPEAAPASLPEPGTGPDPAVAAIAAPHPVEPSGFALFLHDHLGVLVAGFGAFVLGLLFIPDVRHGVVRALQSFGQTLGRLFFDLPHWLLSLPPVRRLLATPPVRLLRRIFVIPGLIAAIPVAIVFALPLGEEPTLWTAGALLIAASATFNSQRGRAYLEVLGDWLARTGDRIKSQLLQGIVRWFLDVFANLLSGIERGLYEIDERLRFQRGESERTLWVKATVGFLWSGIAYLIRFYIVLLIEPQVNPIKHFPVVTVSHKLILPILPTLTEALVQVLQPFTGAVLAWAIAGANIFLLPGVFGFLAWELKENWRLFAINRPNDLRSQVIGSHGESMTRFLRPGFHSGTLPRAYAKLRRAGLDPKSAEDRATPRRWHEAIHHVEEAVTRFVERDLLRLLAASRNWCGFPVQVTEVVARSNCIQIHLEGGSRVHGPMTLTFEQHNGLLIAGIQHAGWIAELDTAQRRVLRNALVGHYHHAGVAIVREEIEARLGQPTPAYDLSRQGLVVWPGPGYEREIVYDLETGRSLSEEGEDLSPLSNDGRPRRRLETYSLRFDRTRIPFAIWHEAWDDDQDEQLQPREIGVGRILPDEPSGAIEDPVRKTVV